MPGDDEELFGGEYKRGDGRAIRRKISEELTRLVQKQLKDVLKLMSGSKSSVQDFPGRNGQE